MFGNLALLSVVVGCAVVPVFSATVTCKRASAVPMMSGANTAYPGATVSTDFDYTYNAAVVPQSSAFPDGPALLVRCQRNASARGVPGAGDFDATPSVIAASGTLSGDGLSSFRHGGVPHRGGAVRFVEAPPAAPSSFAAPEWTSVVLSPAASPLSDFGTEDPRVTYVPGKGHYLFYSAAQDYGNGTVVARLSMSVCAGDPLSERCWADGVRGPVFPKLGWSKSGAFFVDDSGGGHLIFGDSKLQYAVSVNADHTAWKIVNDTFLQTRQGMFDSELVEAGPTPMRLPSGNWLFIYNSARAGVPSPKPGYSLEYNVGFLILDGQNPMHILARSDTPILSPTLAWELGLVPTVALTPRVVFVEGAWVDVRTGEYVLIYGAADTYLGMARCIVAE
jgi:predicted GH43/DUF377 family glycosyl hydrolase